MRTPLTTRLTYATLSENPHWFLDASDFAGPGIALPPVLCPSLDGTAGGCNGMEGIECGAKGAFSRNNGAREDEVKLRCLFCRKSITGGPEERNAVRARWIKHVTDQHGVSLESTSKSKEKVGQKQGISKEGEAVTASTPTPEPTTRPRGRGSMSIEELLAPTPVSSPPRTYHENQGIRRAQTQLHISPSAQKDNPPSISTHVKRAATVTTAHVRLAPRRPDMEDLSPRKRRRTGPLERETSTRHDANSASLRIRLPATRVRSDGVGVGV